VSGAARPRIGRSYTRARRHPWVLGKLGDWRIPMGPYTPPQLAVASIGAFALIRTATLWWPLVGPLPVIAWGAGIWAARHSRIAGRAPFPVLVDALLLALSPRAGRIAGRAVRAPRPVWLTGSFGIEEAPSDDPAPGPEAAVPTAAPVPTPQPSRAAPLPDRSPATRPAVAAAAPTGPALTPLQQMLAAAAAAHTQPTTVTTDKGAHR